VQHPVHNAQQGEDEGLDPRLRAAKGKHKAQHLPNSHATRHIAITCMFGGKEAVQSRSYQALCHHGGLPPEHAIAVGLHKGTPDTKTEVPHPGTANCTHRQERHTSEQTTGPTHSDSEKHGAHFEQRQVPC
jgi:hypothetical protein